MEAACPATARTDMDETLQPAWHGIKGGNMRLWVIDGQMSRVQGLCVKTGELWSVKVKTSELLPYLRGIKDGTNRPLIQDAFPTMNEGGREFLISGISPSGWEQIYKETNG